MVDGALISNTENGVRIKTWQVCTLTKLIILVFSVLKEDKKITEI